MVGSLIAADAVPLDDMLCDEPSEGGLQHDAFFDRPEFQGLLFPAPPEGIDTELVLFPERLPAPYFLRLRPCFVRVFSGDYSEAVPHLVPLRDGVRIAYLPGFALGW